jgi:hypothetical protein
MTGFIILAVLALIGIAGYVSEKRLWNNGICKYNDEPWAYFDTDSQGGRGYKAGEFTCWVSYPGIDN